MRTNKQGRGEQWRDGERGKKTTKRGGDENGGAHTFYLLVCLGLRSCLFMFVCMSKIKICLFMSVGLCM